jgi:hypothetical protein
MSQNTFGGNRLRRGLKGRFDPKLLLAVGLLVSTGCQQVADRKDAPAAQTAAPPPGHIATTPTCPAKDFGSFLQAFAADETVRNKFTARMVRVTDWVDPNETSEGTKTIEVPRSEYRDFSLRYKDGNFHHVSPAGKIDQEPVQVLVKQKGLDFDVKYTYGMSDGNSWRFSGAGDCWRLTDDPEPSDP